ncbi:unnamed protein product [Onchocerca flexuosa]|uniref:Uncharacterized protein n=1 Tax=Onchocerca flexuosa TaxID=387005 RepID=A0A183HQL8_9BILA|nr:unnamed protein product [Onchocerca flexuosa]
MQKEDRRLKFHILGSPSTIPKVARNQHRFPLIRIHKKPIGIIRWM